MTTRNVTVQPYEVPGGTANTEVAVSWELVDANGAPQLGYDAVLGAGVAGAYATVVRDTAVTVALPLTTELVPQLYWRFKAQWGSLTGYRSYTSGLIELIAGDDLTLSEFLALEMIPAAIVGLTADEIAAIRGAASPSADNVFATLDDVSGLIAAVKYYPVTMLVDFGTLESGAVADLVQVDEAMVEISEASGANALQVEFTFSDVISFKSVELYGRYDGSNSHEVAVEIWDYNLEEWEQYGTVGNSDVDRWYFWPLADSINHISDGAVRLRFRHLQSGNTSHDFFIDYLALDATVQGTTLAHSQLTGRSVEGQHPATAISNTPAGSIVATTVQAAIDELDTKKAPTTHDHDGVYDPAGTAVAEVAALADTLENSAFIEASATGSAVMTAASAEAARTTLVTGLFAPDTYLQSGELYCGLLGNVGFTTHAPVADAIQAQAMPLTKTTTFTGIVIAVASAGAAGSTMRCAVYADNGVNPGALIAAADGEFALDSATVQEINFATPLTLSPGLYWLAYHISSSATLRVVQRTNQLPIRHPNNISATTSPRNTRLGSSAYASGLPDPYPTGGWSYIETAAVWLRAQ